MTTNQLDIDKYEGHTEGEWILNRSEANPTEFLLKCGDVTITWLEPSEADAQLIADAPLLLAEVKRLREILDDYRRFHIWIGEKDYELIAEWDEMESEEE